MDSASPFEDQDEGWRQAAGRRVRMWAGAVLDGLLPPVCLKCREPVQSPGQLCAGCWQAVTFLGPPQCRVCGVPFPFETGPETACAACLGDPPDYDQARAALLYDDQSRDLILAFKHGDRLEAAPALGQWMARAGASLLAGDPLLVPVPLHRWRLIRRRYNQAALLAQAVARRAETDWDPLLLGRTKPTRSQGGLSGSGRRRNVAGAFALRDGAAARIDGRSVVLIDDVLTTGATVEACARVLRRAGAPRVDVLTLARTAQPRTPV